MLYLTAVNSVLATIGEAPLAALGTGHPIEDAATKVIDLVAAREVAKGWWFNTVGTAPYPAATVAFTALPESFAQYVVALAQVRFIKDFDGDETKATFYGGEATLARAAMFAEHLRNILASMNTGMAAATAALIKIAENAVSGNPADVYRTDALMGANRVDITISKAIDEANTREQLKGWWFNIEDEDTGDITVVDFVDLPDSFAYYVTALAALRVAQVYGASKEARDDLLSEVTLARATMFAQHMRYTLDQMSSLLGAATASLIRVAEASINGTVADVYRSDVLISANRLDHTINKALSEVNNREQLAGWWFNTDTDTGVITVETDLNAVPASFLEYVTSMAAVRIAKVYGASQAKIDQLKEEAQLARIIVGREQIRQVGLNLLYTPAVVRALVPFSNRYRIR